MAESRWKIWAANPLLEVNLFIAAVQLHARTGGTSQRSSNERPGREHARIDCPARRGSRARGHGKLTGLILSILPIGIATMMMFFSPGYMQVLFNHPMGKNLIMSAAICLVLAHFVIRKSWTLKYDRRIAYGPFFFILAAVSAAGYVFVVEAVARRRKRDPPFPRSWPSIRNTCPPRKPPCRPLPADWGGHAGRPKQSRPPGSSWRGWLSLAGGGFDFLRDQVRLGALLAVAAAWAACSRMPIVSVPRDPGGGLRHGVWIPSAGSNSRSHGLAPRGPHPSRVASRPGSDGAGNRSRPGFGRGYSGCQPGSAHHASRSGRRVHPAATGTEGQRVAHRGPEKFRRSQPRPGLRKFANLLIDTDRFGTSLGPALETHARYLRIRFRQIAQEKARKVGVKLIFPIFFLIFPSVVLVTLGPAVILLFSQMSVLLGQ